MNFMVAVGRLAIFIAVAPFFFFLRGKKLLVTMYRYKDEINFILLILEYSKVRSFIKVVYLLKGGKSSIPFIR